MGKTKNANSIIISAEKANKIIELYNAGFYRKQICSILNLPYYIVIRTINGNPELVANRKPIIDSEFFTTNNINLA